MELGEQVILEKGKNKEGLSGRGQTLLKPDPEVGRCSDMIGLD